MMTQPFAASLPRRRRPVLLLMVAIAAGASTLAAAPAPGDVVLDWNVVALATTAAAPFNPPLETRNLAIVHAAIFDAVNAIDGEFTPYAVELRVRRTASPEAAAVAAAHLALVTLYPDQREQLDRAYASSLAAIGDGPAKLDGIAIGEAVAGSIVRRRASDGADRAMAASYTPGTAPGEWRPTPPASRAALDPGWGTVRPFLLRCPSQFRPGPPPVLTGRQYARDVVEMVAVGSATSLTRTPAQADLARMWVATAPQNWNPIARQAAVAQGFTLSQNARAFALLNLAGADAFIAAWDAKFAYRQWRPVTAIRAADEDGNPDTTPDPDWSPLLVTPPFPDYIAGHTTYAGAASRVLDHVFGRDPGVSLALTSATAPGVMRTYSTFADIATDVVDARVWGGIHWRTSSERGRQVGAQIGALAVRRFLKPREPRHDDR